jgi:hypothetical protein
MLNQIRYKIHLKHYSIRTKKAYLHWIKRPILLYNHHHPMKSGVYKAEYCLSRLVSKGYVTVGTQNQALAALLFLYREVLDIHLPSRDRDTRYLPDICRGLWR